MEFKEGNSDLKNIFNRFKKRNFSGDTGQAIKNSTYQLMQNVFMKFGSLIFTIIIARLLLPDRMGLYNLALSTIILFSAFSDLGVGNALMTFVSKSLGKKNYSKAKSYTKKLLKWKIYLLFLSAFILGISSYFIANYYYNKPIFYALLAGVFYIPAIGILSFVENIYKANNNFKLPMIKEIVFQASRFILLPLGVLLLLKLNLSNQRIVFSIIMLLVCAYLISILYLIIKARKKISFLKAKSKNLNKKEINSLYKFLLPLTTISLSGIFFGYIDTLMLGHYVSERFIAYYGAAFSLVGSAAVLIGFTAGALLPIFARKEGNQLEKMFKKTRNFTFLLSFLGGILTYFVAYYVVLLAYGSEYLPATGILKIFAILVFLLPLSGLYDSYFTAKEKTKVLMWLLIISTILNVVFNVIGITYGLKNYGEMGAVYGACIATILSRSFYLLGSVCIKRKNN